MRRCELKALVSTLSMCMGSVMGMGAVLTSAVATVM